MVNGITNLCHVHIPKNGGHWINSTILFPIDPCLKEKGISLKVAHAGWKDVNDSSYVISSWRDPAKRTISHYFHSKNKFNSDYSSTSEYDLVNWINNNKFIRNYQSKNLLYVPDSRNVPFFYAEDKIFKNINPEISAVRERINRINILIKVMTDFEGNAILNKVTKDLDLDRSLIDSKVEINFNSNDNSRMFWENCSSKLKDYLYEINSIDSEIYFDNSNNWSSRER